MQIQTGAKMSDEQIRIIQIAIAEHKIRIDTMEKLLIEQNKTLAKLSEQFGKLQQRLTTIGVAAIAVLSVTSEPVGQIIRTVLGAAV